MKFTKGYWLNLPGVENADCVQIREVRVEQNRVYLYACLLYTSVHFVADDAAHRGLSHVSLFAHFLILPSLRRCRRGARSPG